MMNLTAQIPNLKNKLVTLDTNILLLYVIGSINKAHIAKFKRTRIFASEDFDLLMTVISGSQLLISPNVATEASNFLESYSVAREQTGLIALDQACRHIIERYKASKELFDHMAYLKYGLSDASIMSLCEAGAIAVTVDFPLYGFIVNSGLMAINFNQIRGSRIFN